MKFSVPRGCFYVLFTLSGFAGLIYESIWSHYLKLFLGHAAYAQTLVLAIFMGGMALGSWICSRYSGRWRNLLLGYAIAEGLIGLTALVFHRVFIATTEFAFDSVIPALGSPLAVNGFKWGLATLLILPQSILLGMTFPLMTAGIIRAYPGGSGGAIAMLYFTNSLGAAAGVLASGFILIALTGLPGTMLTAGLINVLLAAVVWLLAKAMPDTAFPVPAPRRDREAAPVRGFQTMLAISLLTGVASFIYEIGWIRMLSLVLGSSTHAFELMLSAFILGLAFGGLWIKRRIDAFSVPETVLGVVQVVMGILALATLVVYGQTFEIMGWLFRVVARNESGYTVYNLGSHLIALLVMFPAAFCAGMTLPLITHALLRRGSGERSIGAVYAANTLGAILGVFFAVHLGMPLLGLKGLIVTGAVIDIALGLYLLWGAPGPARRLATCATAAGVAAVVISAAFVGINPHKLASGVYRHGASLAPVNAEILFHRDGKAATVNLLKFPDGVVSLLTNGKSDAALNLRAPNEVTKDEVTMIMTAALPLAMMPEARTVANIGFGSGLSTHVFLGSDYVREVDSIEIEAQMIEAARGFQPRIDRAFNDPRSRIHIEDAKTFFSSRNKRYDIISSEPSNPWVSGVASLFTDEFYRRVSGHLNPGGLFVQWLQLYEISPALVATIFKALARNFDDYVVYSSYEFDIVIVARNGAALPPPSSAVFRQPRLAQEFERIRIRSAGDLELHRIGNKRALQPFFDDFSMPPNSDFFPVLDLNAAKARFLGAASPEIVNLASTSIPAVEMLGAMGMRRGVTPAARPWLNRAERVRQMMAGRDYLLDGDARALAEVPDKLRSDFQLVRQFLMRCAASAPAPAMDSLFVVIQPLVRFLTAEELSPLWARIKAAPCAARLAGPLRSWLELFEAVGARDADRMARVGERLLRGGGTRAREHVGYLLGSAVTAHLARGEVKRGAALWHEYSVQADSSENDLLPDLLRAHLRARLARDRATRPDFGS